MKKIYLQSLFCTGTLRRCCRVYGDCCRQWNIQEKTIFATYFFAAGTATASTVATYCHFCSSISKSKFVNEKSVNFVLIKTMLRLWCWTSFPFTFSSFQLHVELLRVRKTQIFPMNYILYIYISYNLHSALWMRIEQSAMSW